MKNQIELFDTHCHLDDPKLVNDIDGILQRARQAGLVGMATIGCDYRSSLFALHMAEKHEELVAVVGFHPTDSDKLDKEQLEELAELAQAPKARAIGEIGLDYHWDNVPREVQRQKFIEQIHLAKDLKMPIVIHDRDAHGDLFNICRSENAGEFGGIMHCFSGSWELAKEAMKMGFMISAGGPVTFKNSRQLPEVVRNIPLDYLLLETDSPYLTPEPYRGKINEPANVFFVAERIAQIRNMPLEELAHITTENAKRFYQIK